ncbi:MAG: hypothetical protein ABSF26_22970 [Thermoguttaceae bacterium]|jgi:hypothetical protein
MSNEDHGRKPNGDLSPGRMQLILDRVGWIVQQNQPFKVIPPREVMSDRSILRGDDVLDRLRGTKWRLSLADGREEELSFTEMMVTAYNLFHLRGRLQELQSQGNGPTDGFDISFKVDPSQIMTPEGVKALLSKLDLEE